MGNFIKYERITGQYDSETLQELFDKLITEGKEIIQYNERTEMIKHPLPNGSCDIEIVIHATIVTGRRNASGSIVL